ncbi:MAG: iron ABC transporter ATP-binding protein [Naasia sp.]
MPAPEEQRGRREGTGVVMSGGPSRTLVRKRMSWVLTGVVAIAVLSGCTSNPVQPGPAPTAEPSASGDVTAPETTATAEPEAPTGIPVTQTCDELITPDEMYEFNPNFGADPGYSPDESSPAQELVDLQGVSCSWLNQTSNETIEVAVAHLDPADVEARKNDLVTSSQPVPTFSPTADEGYFSFDGTTGRADAFVGEYWIMADSSVFFEPGDAQLIIEDVAGALS